MILTSVAVLDNVAVILLDENGMAIELLTPLPASAHPMLTLYSLKASAVTDMAEKFAKPSFPALMVSLPPRMIAISLVAAQMMSVASAGGSGSMVTQSLDEDSSGEIAGDGNRVAAGCDDGDFDAEAEADEEVDNGADDSEADEEADSEFGDGVTDGEADGDTGDGDKDADRDDDALDADCDGETEGETFDGD